jgi:branched-chain amino acid transport system substrate-binding protein
MKLVAAGLVVFASVTIWASNANANIEVGIVVSASGPGSALGHLGCPSQSSAIVSLAKD